MSETLQDAIKILRELGPIFDPTEDYLTIVAAEEQMGHVAQVRQKEMDQVNTDLKALSRTLDTARVSSTRPPTIPSEEAHAKILNDLDAMRLSIAKSINDAEGVLTSKEAELAGLKDECLKLEASDPAAEHELDATALKLAFFKGLGFEPVTDKDGHVRKVLIRSQSGEVHCVSVDGRPREEQPNLLWQLASS
ncbi:hypothetical protein SCHPADRAFT_856279 [Schizopora paradoxa]|uniref:Kinetochore protein Spc24 n=1 Tax=Schizopora paradoxa TaxID=27342 RepID=A0A0H2S0Z8_9AGAM|nr:hypothetical protein SCHPADRAFT_856279 [Schizopora paradoxa]